MSNEERLAALHVFRRNTEMPNVATVPSNAHGIFEMREDAESSAGLMTRPVSFRLQRRFEEADLPRTVWRDRFANVLASFLLRCACSENHGRETGRVVVPFPYLKWCSPRALNFNSAKRLSSIGVVDRESVRM
jgi:hypothetical protein